MPPPPSSPPRHFLRNATVMMASALTIMSGATIAPALPSIEAHFSGTPHAELLTRLVLTMPALFIVLCAPFAGMVVDRLGRRPVLVAAAGLFALAGSSGLYADSLTAILIGRALLGVAVAGTMTAATALVGDYFEGPARDRFMGLQSAFVALGGLVFLSGGGALAELHWRAPFAVYVLSAVLLPLILTRITEPARPRRAAPGFTPAPMTRAEGAAIAAALGLATLNSLAFYVIPTQLPFHMLDIAAGGPAKAGFAIGLNACFSAAVSLAYPALRRKLKAAGVFAAGFAAMAGGFWVLGAAENYTHILASTALVGMGMGAILPNIASSALAAAPLAARGRVAGGLTASIFLGHFISPLVSQPWVAAFGYSAAFRDMGIALAVLAAACAATLVATRRKSV